ncbi:MAG TPA: hypothetical protein VK817_25145 [Trebonia sp.]|jgi:hypothetical protein|nr:hypothetical protein [Trebonia sp.]
MDIEELTAALADPAHAPEPATVMAALERKRRRRGRQRWSVAGGCLAAAAAAVIAAVVVIPPGAPQESGASRSAAGPAVAGPRSSAHGADSGRSTQHISGGPAQPSAAVCGAISLSRRVADAVGAGGSVVIADATARGIAAGGRQPVVLSDARTLRGPQVAAGTAGYAVSGFTGGDLHGQVFAIVLPGGEVLTAPVAGGTVRFGSARCWGTADAPLSSVEQVAAGNQNGS